MPLASPGIVLMYRSPSSRLAKAASSLLQAQTNRAVARPARMAHSQAKGPSTAAASNSSFVDRRPDFKKAQSTRPEFNKSLHPVTMTRSPNPDWEYGSGVAGKKAANNINSNNNNNTKKPDFVDIDPYAEGRSMMSNYRLLVSGIVPRPIGFISTVSKKGEVGGGGASYNLAPFSYFQVVDHDPPTLVVGFSSRPGSAPKDTYRNLLATGECTINLVNEDMIEAVVSTSADAPHGVSEWDVSGLTPAPAKTVSAPRVQESIFAIEGRLVDSKELGHASPGASSGAAPKSVAAVVLIEATRFWVRKDAIDPQDPDSLDINVARPVAQIGGIGYARLAETYEVPRKTWSQAVGEAPWLAELPNKHKE